MAAAAPYNPPIHIENADTVHATKKPEARPRKIALAGRSRQQSLESGAAHDAT